MKKNSLFLKKSIHASFVEEEKQATKKHLGAIQLTSVGIGAIIGAGIFVITGIIASQFAGPALLISFLIAAFVCVLTALCYAELAAFIPMTGGIYSYTYVAMGEIVAWFVGWAAILQAFSCCATVASGWSSYFINILKDFGVAFPAALAHAPIDYSPATGWTSSGAIVNLPAVLLLAFFGVLIAFGMKSVARLNNILVAIKLIVIFLFAVLGFFFIKASNLTPFIPENTGVFGEFGWSGILRGAGIAFFAYTGFDAVATLAQEAKNPQSDVPKGIIGSLAVSTIAYICIAIVLTGIVSYKLLNVSDPMALALDAMGPKFFFLAFLVKCAILAGLASVVLIMAMAQTRVLFAISKDGLLPRSFSTLNKKTDAPLFGSIIAVVIPLIAAGLFPVIVLANLVSFTALILFAFAAISVLVLRRTQPQHKRPFKTPLVPYVPLIAAACCIGQLFFFPLTAWIQIVGWLVLGLIFYGVYGYRNSRIRNRA